MSEDYVRVSDVMVPDVITVDRMANVQEAIDIMREKDVRSLVVSRRGPHDEYGFLVVSDIARFLIGEDKSPDRTQVYELMSKPVVTIPADMNIKYAVRLLVRFDLSRAMVVNQARQPVGIITMRDMVLRHFGPVADPAT